MHAGIEHFLYNILNNIGFPSDLMGSQWQPSPFFGREDGPGTDNRRYLVCLSDFSMPST